MERKIPISNKGFQKNLERFVKRTQKYLEKDIGKILVVMMADKFGDAFYKMYLTYKAKPFKWKSSYDLTGLKTTFRVQYLIQNGELKFKLLKRGKTRFKRVRQLTIKLNGYG